MPNGSNANEPMRTPMTYHSPIDLKPKPSSSAFAPPAMIAPIAQIAATTRTSLVGASRAMRSTAGARSSQATEYDQTAAQSSVVTGSQ